MADQAGGLEEGRALCVGGDDEGKQHGVWGEQTFLISTFAAAAAAKVPSLSLRRLRSPENSN